MLGRLEVSFQKISQCENGKIGLNELEKISGSNENVIVLLDINMPVLDGWGFLDALEQNECYGIHDLSVFIVSSSIDESDLTKAKEYDLVRQFIHKPIEFNTLKQVLMEVNG
jgi:CheY-like chemotaxis protein